MQNKRKMVCSKCRNTSFEVFNYELVTDKTKDKVVPFPVQIIGEDIGGNVVLGENFQCTNCGLIDCTEGLIM